MSDKVIPCPPRSLSHALNAHCSANILRDSHLFNGIKIGGLSVKVSMFADDTMVFLNGLKNQFEYVFDIFQTFGRMSGCRLNLDKSETFHNGSNIFRNDHPIVHLGLKWPQHTVNYPGVTIPIKSSKDKFDLFRINLGELLRQISSKIKFMENKRSYLIGKITFLKVLFYLNSIINYLCCQLKFNHIYKTSINALIYGFIWGSKWERISQLDLACCVEMGSAKMLHLPVFVLALQWKHLQHFFHQCSIFLPL